MAQLIQFTVMKNFIILWLGGLFMLPCTSSAQTRLPDLPNENVDAIFVTSPVTINPAYPWPDLGIRGYLLSWNPSQEQWLDTIAMLEQTSSPLATGKIFSEVLLTKAGGATFNKVSRTEIYNPLDWNGQSGTSPDSVIFFRWNVVSPTWIRQKKVSYRRNDTGDLSERSVTLYDNAQPDTLEKIFVDSVWDHLVKQRFLFDAQLHAYSALDSSVYVFYNGLCQSFGLFDQRNGANKPIRRHRFKYFGDAENFTHETDFWSDSLNFWKTKYKFSQTVIPDEYRTFWQYDTLTNVAWQSYKRVNRLFLDNWEPASEETGYFPLLGTLPDSSCKQEFFYDPVTGFLKSVLTSAATSDGDWQPLTQWVFDANPSSVGIKNGANHNLEDVQLFTLGKGVFQVILPETALPGDARLLDSTGKLLQTRKMQDPVLNLDISAQPAGLYYLQVLGKNQFKTIPLHVP